MQLHVLFEDSDILVLDKPAGISVTPGPGHLFEDTIAGWLLDYLGDDLYEVGQEDRWGIVHRLDKDTSGVLVTAKSPPMYEHLVEQFRNSRVAKEYVALTWGKVSDTVEHKLYKKHQSTPANTQEFVINAPIGRHPKGISRFLVDPQGKPSLTKFLIQIEVEGNIGTQKQWLTLLSAFPKTGRTHQIRVHLKAFGHPIVGDAVYQTHAQKELAAQLLERQFLHAYALECEMLNGQSKRFEAELPEDLTRVVEKLQ
jgi:23S rRNA pseudouridine1911/1915/1917 synthase